MSKPLKLIDLVTIQPGAAAIVLTEGLKQKDLISSFVPTESAISILKHIQNAVQYHGEQQDRAINCYGVYGSGKSRLAVLIGQMLRDGVHSSEFENFLDRLKSINEVQFANNLKSTFLDSSDEDARPYLIVPIYGRSGTTIQSDLVENLYRAVQENKELNASEILLKTEYTVAVARLDEILDQAPELKDTYLPELDLGNEYHDPSSLRQGLFDHQQSALNVFSDWHKKLTFGTPFDAVNHGASLAKEIYLNAAKQLEKKYRGIAIIWDEFGYALENMLDEQGRSPIQEVFELQEFVETVCSPHSSHVLFIGLTHVSLSEYGHRANASEDIKSRIETIQGRFTSLKVELRPAELEGYHLLAAQLLPTEKGITLKHESDEKANKIADICKDIPLFGRIEQDLLGIIRNCYPLHPLTSAALLALSSRYAAATRTAFHFLSEMSRDGFFNQEVNEKNLYSNELIRLPLLVNFYEEAIKKDGHTDQFKNFKLACSQLKSIGDDPQAVLERENILSILMLSSLLDSNFQSSNELLSIALHDSKYTSPDAELLRESLDWLSKAGLIWRNETTKLWNMGGAGGTDFETLLNGAIENVPNQKLAQYISAYKEISSELMPMLGEHSLDPSPKGIVRSFVVEILSNIPTVRPRLKNYNSAKVYIVVSNSPEESAEIEQAILLLPSDEIYYWFCFEDLSKLQSKFRTMLAILNLIGQTHTEETKIRLLSKYESVRSDLLNYFGIFYGREGLSKDLTKVLKQGSSTPISVKSWNDFFGHIQESVNLLYNKELAVRASQKKRNILGDFYHVDSAETEEIVKRILNFESNKSNQTDLLGYSESSEPGAVVDGILGANNFFIQRPNNIWDIRKLDELDANTKSVIEFIKKETLRIRPGPFRLKELAETLASPPYGIPMSALPIFIALAIREDISRIAWVQGSAIPAANICKAILDDKVGLRVQDFTQYHLNVAEVLMSSLKEIMDETDTHVLTEKHAKARRSLELLKTYLDSISVITINSPKLNKGLRVLYDTSHAIGKTNHDLLERVSELIDQNKVLSGTEISFEAKCKARDDLQLILKSHIQVENQQKYEAISHIEGLLPNLNDSGSVTSYIDLFSGAGELGISIASIIQDNTNPSTRYEKILSKVLNKSVSNASELELGMGVGKLENIIQNEKKYLYSDNLDEEILATLKIKILEIATESSLNKELLTNYLHTVTKRIILDSE